ncbi:MAG: hypothetical protein Q7S51_02285 [Gallionellaceae bacterium]|nr:hypothetical protein [Gallionellaceae bacterium]
MRTMLTLTRKLQQGFSLVTAIFLLVVLGGLGAMMMTFFTAQQQSSALDVLGSRAYQAARAGIEWAAYNVESQPAGTQWVCPTPQQSLTLGGTLAAFNVSVTCATASFVEGGTTIYIYDIVSSASGVNGATVGSPDYVERVISARLGK